jgi:hypothetical protein
MVLLEGLGKFKRIHLIGNRTGDLLACSIVPQPINAVACPLHLVNTYVYFLLIVRNTFVAPERLQGERVSC